MQLESATFATGESAGVAVAEISLNYGGFQLSETVNPPGVDGCKDRRVEVLVPGQARTIPPAGRVWLNPTGTPVVPADWDQSLAHALGVFYNGISTGKDWRGRPITGASFLLCFNSHDRSVTFTLPPAEYFPR
ncbi:hypothetical protein [Arthrobacter agilis]|uniref:hypothetical protein n=1 Tax=Arthrobacter agilis TaxID=37921 RepID=UPI00278B0094|nr:hypothetical protein [Arthrobacter agilis]MDQ0734764.1 hypothetical protein [Arthrobacter agilis]